MIKHWRRAVATALAVGVIGALAGPTAVGASTSGSAGASATAAPAKKATGDPIVIGTICSCSGVLAPSLGRVLDVMEIWVKWTNAHGGVNGHPIELHAYDDGQNAAEGLAAAKKLVEEDHVVAIVGQMSFVGTSWSSYVDQAGVPVVGGSSVDVPYIVDPNFYPSGATLPLQLKALVDLAKGAGKKTLGVYYCAETPVCAQLPTIIEAVAKDSGLKVTSAKVSQSAPNYTAPCLQFKNEGVDVVFGGVNSDVVPRIADDCARQGFKPLSVATSSTTQRNWLGNENLEGSLVAGTNAVYTNTSVAGVKDFLAAIKKYDKGLLKSPQFSWPTIFPWAGGELFAAVAEAAGLTPTSTSADVVDGLAAIKDDTLDGLAPPLTFVTGETTRPLCYFTAVVKNGAFKPTKGGKATCITEAESDALYKAIGLG